MKPLLPVTRSLMACCLLPTILAAAEPAIQHDPVLPTGHFEQVLFVKRHTYNSNHYYTEFINSSWQPGGNLCLLNLNDNSVKEVVTDLKNGVFERFDLSFDAKRVVFAWKKGPQDGYRIYEVNLDGQELYQAGAASTLRLVPWQARRMH